MNRFQPDKPYISYEEMITLLRSRGVIIDDESFAYEALDSISYYTLINGFKSPFLSDDDTYLEGTRFEDLYFAHIIDMSLSSVLLKHLLYIEHALKSRVSHLVASRYGVVSHTDLTLNGIRTDRTDYLYRGNYSNHNRARNNTLRHLTEILQGVKISRDGSYTDTSHFQSKSLIHYREHHNHIPPWILTTSMTLGETRMWYNIMKPGDKCAICDRFIPPADYSSESRKEFFTDGLKLINDFRNSVAHGRPVYSTFSEVSIPGDILIQSAPGLILESEYPRRTALSGVQALISVLYILSPDDYVHEGLLSDIISAFALFEAAPLMDEETLTERALYRLFGLPKDYIDRLYALYRM